MMLLVGLPALVLGGVIAYQGNSQIQETVDQGAAQVQTWIHNETAADATAPVPEQTSSLPSATSQADSHTEPAADPSAQAAQTADLGNQAALAPALLPDSQHPLPPADPSQHPVAKPKKTQTAKPVVKKEDAKSSAAPAQSPKEQTSKSPKGAEKLNSPPETDLPVRTGSLTLSQAQELASRLFGGEQLRSHVAKNKDSYEMTWRGGQKAAPFDVAPKVITIFARGLNGRFTKSQNGFLVFLSVTDPQAPEWTHTYLGAALVSGTPDHPGRVIGTTAVQAPKGRFTRREARDLDGDGIAELVMEVESHSPGGYVQRDLAVHKFGRSGTTILFASRTLEDGPGVPTSEAKFKEISFQDSNKDGIDEIVVKEGVKTFEVDETLYRTPTGQRFLSTRTFKLTKGRYRVATK